MSSCKCNAPAGARETDGSVVFRRGSERGPAQTPNCNRKQIGVVVAAAYQDKVVVLRPQGQMRFKLDVYPAKTGG